MRVQGPPVVARALVYGDRSELSRVRDEVRAGEPTLAAAVERLRVEAEALLRLAPTSVIDKTSVAASGDPHDFFAIGAYSWPDPSKPGGLPYIYRDSETNPEATTSTDYDKGPYEEMTRRVAILALAYFYTDDTRFAAHGTKLLRAWFCNVETRMNPNFRYAAGRPGVWDGHFSGVIEGVYLIEMLDAVALLEDSPLWSESDSHQLRSWFGELSDWLVTSPFGRREVFTSNNHGSYVLAQIIAFSAFAGQTGRARRAVVVARKQLRRQIKADGSLPRELDRVDGWFYSFYGLRAFVLIARLSEVQGFNLWRDEPRLAQACSSLASYATGHDRWTFGRGSKPWKRDAAQLFRIAARAYESTLLAETAAVIVGGDEGAYPYAELLGGASSHLADAGRLPEPVSWSTASLDGGLRVRAETLSSRLFGVLAARGLWPGRALR